MPNQFRDDAHQRMLDAALDAATDEVITRGWTGLRMRAIAEQIGISRQTLYNAFSDKHGIAQALVDRHNARFLAGVEHAVRGEPELRARWAAAVRYTLRTAAEDPLFKAILDAESSEEFLPLITSGGEPVVVGARERLTAIFGELHPDLDRVDLEAIAEMVTRLTLSHIVLPLHPIDTVAGQLGDLAVRYLRVAVG
ncbi:MAG TPA: TetR family transcriptional regulator [Pseudonocardia sp.]|nr:TetR family transcriptional regulator [Pseudonocardia sp.]